MLQSFGESRFFRSLLQELDSGHSPRVSGLRGSALSILLYLLFNNLKKQILVVVPDSSRAEAVFSDLLYLLGSKHVNFFPEEPSGKIVYSQAHYEIKGQRLRTLESLVSETTAVFVATAQALVEKLPPPRQMASERLFLQVGATVDFEELVSRLVNFGYERVEMVGGAGEFSVRGGIVDIFPFEEEWPVRVEFFGDVVDSVRRFDVVTQRSTKVINQISILKPDEGEILGGSPVSLPAYLRSDGIIFFDQPEAIEQAILERTGVEGSSDKEDSLGKKSGPLFSLESLRTDLGERLWIQNSLLTTRQADLVATVVTHESFRGNLRRLEEVILHLWKHSEKKPKIFISLEEEFEVQRFRDLFEERGLLQNGVTIGRGHLSDGFYFPDAQFALFTEKDIYGRVPKRKRWGKYRGGAPIKSASVLSPGDFVVHEDFGIGKFVGLAHITVNGSERETVQLEYRDGDKLYVPIDKVHRLQKYTGREGFSPQLSKLGGPDWERLKSRTKQAIEEMAKKLLDVYAVRKAKQGFAFSTDTLWQKELEASFIYDETPDQLRTIREIKRDMEAPTPMDRLVCGDVGFGKTEVALRAAFKATMDSKQVAILVPTTVLAQQHYNTFRERLRSFPLKVALLSRFRSLKEQKEVIKGLKDGTVDIVIGTHRLLSKDVVFRDLGLLIIDEEHRFGVAQKERLKEKFPLVDVLALSATPIPRTLHFSIMGARDMSNINTPPPNRLPILTEVVPFDKRLIRQAILSELHRGGQVFFVHNRVQSITAVAEMLQRLVPEARIAVAHGKMHGHELEKIMVAFLNKEYDCLVSTMIIESGLDLPNVNTLIVNRADRFGLAQLYQLRGRVGRSNRQAYTYFLVPPVKYLTEASLQRLQTLEEFVELGSGLQVAMRDLEIRGAGNLLGPQQSGYINAVGFDMYTKILNESVQKLKKERGAEEELAPSEGLETEVDTDLNALIPQDYVASDVERLQLYRRLMRVRSEEELLEIQEELRDRFGPVPVEVRNLFGIARLRLFSRLLGLEKLRIRKGVVTAYFSDAFYEEEPQKELLQEVVRKILSLSPSGIKFLKGNKFGFKFELRQGREKPLQEVETFLKKIAEKAA